MSSTRSILLIFLSFAVGFVGPLVIEMLGSAFGDMFQNGALPTLIVLGIFWGSPRGIAERKLIEVLLGMGMAFLGLLAISFYDVSLLVNKAAETAAAQDVPLEFDLIAVIVRNAMLGVAIGAVDGLYERRAGKAVLGSVLAAVLSVPGAFVEQYIPGSAQEVFRMAVSWGSVICLIHVGTIATQFLSRAKHHRDSHDDH